MSRNPFDVEVGERLKAVREKARLLQPEFAQRLGLAPRTYQNYEIGERTISAEAIKALYEMFSVDPVWLLSGPGNDPRSIKTPTKPDLLAEIIIKVEQHLAKNRLKLPLEKKARLIVLLNQYIQLKGKVDDDHIEHVLSVSAL
ncbi:helix-turn-helix domain-containing protein [Nevskia soli]|uniref:helix-turn-helix domain-containing protein n=1 Tax=Nevskia soli TaxID=418856 RepID=UPI00068CCEFF|nr:helix-turn-helix transcriptional regulator [Nevskia soli]